MSLSIPNPTPHLDNAQIVKYWAMFQPPKQWSLKWMDIHTNPFAWNWGLSPLLYFIPMINPINKFIRNWDLALLPFSYVEIYWYGYPNNYHQDSHRTLTQDVKDDCLDTYGNNRTGPVKSAGVIPAKKWIFWSKENSRDGIVVPSIFATDWPDSLKQRHLS